MKLAVSNIAWAAADDEPAYRLLADRGVPGLEIAPTRIWSEPDRVTGAAASAFKTHLSLFGLSVVALQALLFGQPQLTIFNVQVRDKTLEYLKRQCDLAAELGARARALHSPQESS